jgi:8-oxo-dGTP diphosphatase
MSFTYEYPRPALTVDCVVLGFGGGDLQVLLIRRGLEPFAGSWALPGGFVDMDEDLDQAARRELEEETRLHDVFLEQLYTFGKPGRDPRGRVVSVAYYALVRPDQHPAAGGSDASEAAWHPVGAPPALAFDHAAILQTALDRLRGKIRYQPVGFELLAKRFTLGQLQSLYEAILGRRIDKRNFRKKLLAFDFIVPTEEFTTGGAHRPARLHRFDRRKYDSLTRKGFHFEL